MEVIKLIIIEIISVKMEISVKMDYHNILTVIRIKK
jgi:hypothetical protein